MVPREAAGSLAWASCFASTTERIKKKGKQCRQTARESLVDKFPKPLTFGMWSNLGRLRSLPFHQPHGTLPIAERRGFLFRILRGLRPVSEVESTPGLPGGRRACNLASEPTAREDTVPLPHRPLH